VEIRTGPSLKEAEAVFHCVDSRFKLRDPLAETLGIFRHGLHLAAGIIIMVNWGSEHERGRRTGVRRECVAGLQR
jgi:hypothetical protein